MLKINGCEIATEIFDRFITAVRDYAREMEDAIVEEAKKGAESKKLEFLKDVDVEGLFRGMYNLDRDMVQPLERIRDKISKCKSSTGLESAVDLLIKLFQDKVCVGEASQVQWVRDMWSKYLQILGALALEINDYCIKQYFPRQTDFVDAKVKVSKGFMTPAPLTPIKVYFASDYIQHAYTTDQGEWTFKLPKGEEFTFWTLKDGKEVSKSVFLSGDTKIKL